MKVRRVWLLDLRGPSRQKLSNPITDVQGFVARDNDQKEIVVALRGRLDNPNHVHADLLNLIIQVSPW